MFIRYKDRYAEYILYVLFGTLITIINFITYFIFTKAMGLSTVTSNLTAITVSIIFSYLTNKLFVFNSKRENIKELISEITAFVSTRMLTGLLDTLFIVIGVEYMKASDFVVKTISFVIVIIINYVLSNEIFNK